MSKPGVTSKTNTFSVPRRIEADYRRSIDALFAKYLSVPIDATPEYVLNAFASLSKNAAVIEDIARRMARRMITQLRVSNARSWRVAAEKSSRGREIFALLQNEMRGNVGGRVREIVSENSRLISSIPEKLREEVNHEIARLEREGERPSFVAAFLRRRIPELTKVRAALVARTEVGKASTALTRARAEELDIPGYQWQTSKDSRVRPSHRLMQGVLVLWDDPPSPEALANEGSRIGYYHAGGAPNCRCDTYPIVSLDRIEFPARVYSRGGIRRMGRAAFVNFSGIRRAA
jgi:SPP1 gp7 family putative phage head morphogenesis protein